MAITRGTFKGRGAGYTDKGVAIRCVRADQSSITLTLHYLSSGNAMAKARYSSVCFIFQMWTAVAPTEAVGGGKRPW